MRAAVLLVAALAGGCVRLTWTREARYAPLPAARELGLVEDETTMAECLAVLGAPLWVWEHDEDGASGAALAYGWFHERGLGVRVSGNVYRSLSASVDYDQIDQRMRGLVLFFDADGRLTRHREGLLRDLTREARRPPPPLPEDL